MNYKILAFLCTAALTSCSAPNSDMPVKNIEPGTPITVQIPVSLQTEQRNFVTTPASRQEIAIPMTTETVTKQVLRTPARTVHKVVPAIIRQVPRRDPTGQEYLETIVVREASTETVTIPPVYETVTETVVVQPATVELVEIPPVYETRAAEILKPTNPFDWSLDPTNSLPYFKPPKTSVTEDIDNKYFTKTENGLSINPNLREVFEQIASVLTSHEKLGYSYRVFKYDKGFAILTDPERIQDDGSIHVDADGGRINPKQENAKNFGEYVSAFFRAPENRVRYIAFIVTSKRNIKPSSEEVNEELLEVIYESGDTRGALPLDIMEKYEFDSSYRVQVRVYEFPTLKKVKIKPANEDLSEMALGPETRVAELESFDSEKFVSMDFKDHKSGSFALDEFFAKQE